MTNEIKTICFNKGKTGTRGIKLEKGGADAVGNIPAVNITLIIAFVTLNIILKIWNKTRNKIYFCPLFYDFI